MLQVSNGASCIVDAENAWVIHLDTSTRKFILEKFLHLQLCLRDKFISLYMNHQVVQIDVILEMHIFVLQMMNVEINNSHKLIKGSSANGKECSFVREGVLSELVYLMINYLLTLQDQVMTQILYILY